MHILTLVLPLDILNNIIKIKWDAQSILHFSSEAERHVFVVVLLLALQLHKFFPETFNLRFQDFHILRVLLIHISCNSGKRPKSNQFQKCRSPTESVLTRIMSHNFDPPKIAPTYFDLVMCVLKAGNRLIREVHFVVCIYLSVYVQRQLRGIFFYSSINSELMSNLFT